jgi:hypothetical protein
MEWCMSFSYSSTSELVTAATSLVETCISGVLRIATSMPLKCQDVMEATPIVIGWMNDIPKYLRRGTVEVY